MTWLSTTEPRVALSDERARQFRSAQRNTRRVRMLRYALPSVAVLLVAVMFLSGLRSPLDFLPEGVNLDGLSFDGERVTMEGPHLTGFGNDGKGYDVRAERAVHVVTNPKVLELFEISGEMTEVTGRRTRLTADRGHFDGNQEFMTLSDGIEIDMDGGYRVFLDNADVDMAAGTVTTSDPVRILANGAELTADSLNITDGGKYLLFEGGVKMTIYPGTAQGQATTGQAVPGQVAPDQATRARDDRPGGAG